MKMNLRIRMKNPWFWVGVVGIILSAMGISPEDLTSWSAVLNMLKDFINNPFMIFTVGTALLGIFVDPTTAGFSDSAQAMSYPKPRNDAEETDK